MSSRSSFLDALFTILNSDVYSGLFKWGADGRLCIQSDMDVIDHYFGKLNMMNGGSFEDFIDQLRDAGFRTLAEESNGSAIMLKHDVLRPNQTREQWAVIAKPKQHHYQARAMKTASSQPPTPNEEDACQNSIPEIVSHPPSEKQLSQQSYEPFEESYSGEPEIPSGAPKILPEKFMYTRLRESQMELHEKVEPFPIKKDFKMEQQNAGQEGDPYRRRIWRHELWEILERDMFPDIISWTTNGNAITVKDQKKLCRDVLGKYLGRSHDFTVFNTQLANHKFRKLFPRDSRKIYVHDFLRRGMGEDMWRQFKVPLEDLNRDPDRESRGRGRAKKEAEPSQEPGDDSFNHQDFGRPLRRRRRNFMRRRSAVEYPPNRSFYEPDRAASEFNSQPDRVQMRELKEQLDTLIETVNEVKSKVIETDMKVDTLTRSIEVMGYTLKKETPSEPPATGSPAYSETQQRQPNDLRGIGRQPNTSSHGSRVSHASRNSEYASNLQPYH